MLKVEKLEILRGENDLSQGQMNFDRPKKVTKIESLFKEVHDRILECHNLFKSTLGITQKNYFSGIYNKKLFSLPKNVLMALVFAPK